MPLVIRQCVSDFGLGTIICMLLGRKRDSGVRWGSYSCHQRCQTVGHASGQHHTHTRHWSVCVSVWDELYVQRLIHVIWCCCCFFFQAGGQEVWRKSNDCHMLLHTHTNAQRLLTGAPGSDVLISAGTFTTCINSDQKGLHNTLVGKQNKYSHTYINSFSIPAFNPSIPSNYSMVCSNIPLYSSTSSYFIMLRCSGRCPVKRHLVLHIERWMFLYLYRMLWWTVSDLILTMLLIKLTTAVHSLGVPLTGNISKLFTNKIFNCFIISYLFRKGCWNASKTG